MTRIEAVRRCYGETTGVQCRTVLGEHNMAAALMRCIGLLLLTTTHSLGRPHTRLNNTRHEGFKTRQSMNGLRQDNNRSRVVFIKSREALSLLTEICGCIPKKCTKDLQYVN